MKTVFGDFATVVCAQNKQFSVSNTVGWFFGDEEKYASASATLRACFCGTLIGAKRRQNQTNRHFWAYKSATNAP